MTRQSFQRIWFGDSSSFSPRREQEPVDDACLPQVPITGRRKQPRIARVDAHVMGQEIVEAEVGLPHAGSGQAVGWVRRVPECLLDAEYRLQSANYAFGATKTCKTISGLDPIPLSVSGVSIL